MRNKKSGIFISLIFFVLVTSFWSCFEMEGTSNSSPRLSVDEFKLTDEIKALSNSESVRLEDFETKRGDKIVKKELRIDLTKPNPFPSEMKIKEIILAARSKLLDSAQFDRYTVTEVPQQEGDTVVVPAQKILKSVTIMSKDL